MCRNGRELPFVAEVRGQDSSHGAAEGGFCPTTGLSVPNGAGTFLDSKGLAYSSGNVGLFLARGGVALSALKAHTIVDRRGFYE
jgi:hypothetical protein